MTDLISREKAAQVAEGFNYRIDSDGYRVEQAEPVLVNGADIATAIRALPAEPIPTSGVAERLRAEIASRPITERPPPQSFGVKNGLIEEAADAIISLTTRVAELEADRDSWRRVAERCKTEVEAAEAECEKLRAALTEALPNLDENYRWHRDAQSSPGRVTAAHNALEQARAALRSTAGGGNG